MTGFLKKLPLFPKTFGFGSLITAFFYNKLYAQELLNNGFKVKSLNGADKDLIKARLGISKL